MSSAMTCTSETMFSQIRGGDIRNAGPISRVSWRAVAVSSGKFTVNPASRPLATPTICSPIHASGRNDTNSSSGYIVSTLCSCDAMASRFACESIASFGTLVVPDVVESSATSPGRVPANRRSNSPGNLPWSASPSASTSSKEIRPGAS